MCFFSSYSLKQNFYIFTSSGFSFPEVNFIVLKLSNNPLLNDFLFSNHPAVPLNDLLFKICHSYSLELFNYPSITCWWLSVFILIIGFLSHPILCLLNYLKFPMFWILIDKKITQYLLSVLIAPNQFWWQGIRNKFFQSKFQKPAGFNLLFGLHHFNLERQFLLFLLRNTR